jgi:predicted dehydrogenase
MAPTPDASPSTSLGHGTGLGARTLRCGAVGVGRMGRHHARVYAQMDGTELVGVVDADSDRAELLAETHDCRAFTTPEQLLEAGVDAVTIAVPTTHHEAAARPFLEAGVACLIEKPLAQDGETALRIKAMAEASGATLMVGHIERFNPAVRAMEKLREQGTDIVPRFVEVLRISPMTFRSVDVGVVMDMMIHDIDVVLNLMGGREPVGVTAHGVAVVTDHEDICNARLTFDTEHGPCVANVSASRLAFKTERVTRITGEGGYVEAEGEAPSRGRRDRTRRTEPARRPQAPRPARRRGRARAPHGHRRQRRARPTSSSSSAPRNSACSTGAVQEEGDGERGEPARTRATSSRS